MRVPYNYQAFSLLIASTAKQDGDKWIVGIVAVHGSLWRQLWMLPLWSFSDSHRDAQNRYFSIQISVYRTMNYPDIREHPYTDLWLTACWLCSVGVVSSAISAKDLHDELYVLLDAERGMLSASPVVSSIRTTGLACRLLPSRMG